jgi:hypothetical protein
MVSPESIIHPEAQLVSAYDQKYKSFIEELKARKILN